MSLVKQILLWPFKAIGWILGKIFGPLLASGNEKIKNRWAVALILVFGVIAAVYVYPNWVNSQIDNLNNKFSWNLDHIRNKEYKLGLDLKGGSQLIYQAEIDTIPSADRTDAMEGVRDVIERRVNAFGISEPKVQVAGEDRLYVELAGITDINEAITKIGETPLLEFKEEMSEEDRELTEEQQATIDEFNATAKTKAEDLLKQLSEGAEFATLATEHSEESSSQTNGGLIDYWMPATQLPENIREKILALEPGQYLNEVDDAPTAINLYQLEEKRILSQEVEASHILICYDGTARCESGLTQEEAKTKIDSLKEQATPENFADLAKENSTEPGAEQGAGYLDFATKGRYVDTFEQALFAAQDNQITEVIETEFGYHLIYRTASRELEEPIDQIKLRKIALRKQTKNDYIQGLDWKYTGLTGTNLKRAQVQFDQQTNEAMVALEFDSEGSDLFKDITTRNVNKRVAIFLDGEAISIPRVNEPILDGKAVITGSFSITEAKTLAQRLNAGALPIPINLIGQSTIGATLGVDSIQASFKAGLLGLMLVCLLMLVIYRLPGLIAIIALLIYGALTLAAFKLIGVTLTLAGIAGFTLSVGMAVDANVLIFERLREELKSGKPLAPAVEDAFLRAWPSIRDGNISTLITCMILAYFGTSIIQGFAITLIIGVCISMFSAIVITRSFLRAIVSQKFAKYKILF